MNPVLVFYMGELYAECSHKEYRLQRTSMPQDVYNKAFIYIHPHSRYKVFGTEPGWYRCDGTPAYMPDVPKKLRAYVLIHFD